MVPRSFLWLTTFALPLNQRNIDLVVAARGSAIDGGQVHPFYDTKRLVIGILREYRTEVGGACRAAGRCEAQAVQLNPQCARVVAAGERGAFNADLDIARTGGG